MSRHVLESLVYVQTLALQHRSQPMSSGNWSLDPEIHWAMLPEGAREHWTPRPELGGAKGGTTHELVYLPGALLLTTEMQVMSTCSHMCLATLPLQFRLHHSQGKEITEFRRCQGHAGKLLSVGDFRLMHRHYIC